MIDLTVLTICYNEEANINFLLDNVCGWCKEIVAVDSGSIDKTVQILESYNARVIYNKFENFSKQRQFSLNNVDLSTKWVLVLDADEILTEELKSEIEQVISSSDAEDAYFIKRRFYWNGVWIKRGYYPTNLLRLGKVGFLDCEERPINEHLICKTENLGQLQHDFIDENHRGLSDWIDKHNKYSSAEALALNNVDDTGYKLFGSQYERKRWLRVNIWNNLPVFLRPLMYLMYRLIIKGGVLDGKKAILYHFLHAFIYRSLIDAKYLENKWKVNETNSSKHSKR